MKRENLQLAENSFTEYSPGISFEDKREMLKKTKIVRQTWSILEIYQKITDKKLILDPDYQRNEIWAIDKKTSFIESLYMGIIIPPIYVVEIPGENMLSENTYEVVDGKQRLSTIIAYLDNKLKLESKSLEYYSDYFGNKIFEEVKMDKREMVSEMLSSVLDIYVITANSPEFTKYDIFSRLNKGAEKLRVNEIRKAIYKSSTTICISKYIENYDKKEYNSIFSKTEQKRFDDYGRFYRSIAFYLQTDLQTLTVRSYNSRPREMINTVLQNLQNNIQIIEQEKVKQIMEKTIELKKKKVNEYYIDACIPFIENWESIISKIEEINNDLELKETLIKSPATTRNVNLRIEILKRILSE